MSITSRQESGLAIKEASGTAADQSKWGVPSISALVGTRIIGVPIEAIECLGTYESSPALPGDDDLVAGYLVHEGVTFTVVSLSATPATSPVRCLLSSPGASVPWALEVDRVVGVSNLQSPTDELEDEFIVHHPANGDVALLRPSALMARLRRLG